MLYLISIHLLMLNLYFHQQKILKHRRKTCYNYIVNTIFNQSELNKLSILQPINLKIHLSPIDLNKKPGEEMILIRINLIKIKIPIIDLIDLTDLIAHLETISSRRDELENMHKLWIQQEINFCYLLLKWNQMKSNLKVKRMITKINHLLHLKIKIITLDKILIMMENRHNKKSLNLIWKINYQPSNMNLTKARSLNSIGQKRHHKMKFTFTMKYLRLKNL